MQKISWLGHIYGMKPEAEQGGEVRWKRIWKQPVTGNRQGKVETNWRSWKKYPCPLNEEEWKKKPNTEM